MYFTTSQLCDLTGVPYGTLKRLRAAGSVLAAQPGRRGRGHSDLWAPEQALALAVARGLRSCGVVAADAEAVLQYLWGQTASALKKQFRADRTCLMLVLGPRGTNCLARLVRRQDVLDNEEINALSGTALGSGIAPSALDVAAIWAFILRKAEEMGVAVEGGAKATHQRKACASGSSPTS
jgi:hypothetical protein